MLAHIKPLVQFDWYRHHIGTIIFRYRIVSYIAIVCECLDVYLVCLDMGILVHILHGFGKINFILDRFYYRCKY